MTFYYHPDVMYETVREGMRKMTGEGTDDSRMTEEEKAMKKKLVAIMRAALKALFITSGDLLLRFFLGKNHPRPPRAQRGVKFDLVEWYMDIFAKIGISYMMKNDIIMKGQLSREEGPRSVFTVFEAGTRPVSEVESN